MMFLSQEQINAEKQKERSDVASILGSLQGLSNMFSKKQEEESAISKTERKVGADSLV